MNYTDNYSLEVNTGEVRFSNGKTQLVASAIGSCIAVALYIPSTRMGGLAHIMLPGRAPSVEGVETYRYAENAINFMRRRLAPSQFHTSNLQVCIVGGGNVLKRDDDTICEENIKSVVSVLKEHGFNIAAKDLGGTERRRIRFDVKKGIVYSYVGDRNECILYDYHKVLNSRDT